MKNKITEFDIINNSDFLDRLLNNVPDGTEPEKITIKNKEGAPTFKLHPLLKNGTYEVTTEPDEGIHVVITGFKPAPKSELVEYEKLLKDYSDYKNKMEDDDTLKPDEPVKPVYDVLKIKIIDNDNDNNKITVKSFMQGNNHYLFVIKEVLGDDNKPISRQLVSSIQLANVGPYEMDDAELAKNNTLNAATHAYIKTGETTGKRIVKETAIEIIVNDVNYTKERPNELNTYLQIIESEKVIDNYVKIYKEYWEANENVNASSPKKPTNNLPLNIEQETKNTPGR
jgi:hypothetical protein